MWAFESDKTLEQYEIPVVAFYGLDISWQAYLFWTINIKPKRINASLAFDLYPLLRTEDWLEKFEGHSIYRETRAQDLVESLWSHKESPWYQWINMLGESGKPLMVTQAAWIRSLMATYVKAWESTRIPIGGLFGSKLGRNEMVLPWSRPQQAAFLIHMGQRILEAVTKCREKWATELRKIGQTGFFENKDSAFYGPYSLLNTDQGIRGLLYVTNDLCYVQAKKLKLTEWFSEKDSRGDHDWEINNTLTRLKKLKEAQVIGDIANRLVKFDWRSSSAPNLSENERMFKVAFRGGGGYRELRHQLLKKVAEGRGELSEAAQKVIDLLGYK